ncbi:MAG: hypothetical protein HPY76_09575 [Anaerolineae bacterium]|nr:hypothetical protein [Anaerolineae bacterium]
MIIDKNRSLQRILLLNRRLRHKRRQETSPSRRFGRFSIAVGLGLLMVSVAGILAGVLLYADLSAGLPSLEQVPLMLNREDGLLLTPTRIYDHTGINLIHTLENPGIERKFLPVSVDDEESISPQIVQVTIALIEPGFWESPGFAWWALTDPQPQTIAEHLARDLLLESEPEGTRKALRMRILAGQLTARYGRLQVLEWYLNSAYYGHLAFGVEQAAQLYLGKSASVLNLAEAALLAAANRAPALNPLDAPAAALEQQQAIYPLLAERGMIRPEEVASLQAIPMEIQSRETAEPLLAKAFTRMALAQASEQVGSLRLQRGGLKVITSMDYDLQREAQCGLTAQLLQATGNQEAAVNDMTDCETARLLPTRAGDNPLPQELQGALVILDVATGRVLALTGETGIGGESPGLRDHAPGSLLTPAVALSGFVRGMSPASLVWDIEATLPPDLAGYQNPDDKEHGPQRLRNALANDHLIPFGALVEQIGAQNAWRLAQLAGLTGLDANTASGELLFAGGRIDILEVAQFYNTLANLGTLVGNSTSEDSPLQPTLIVSITDHAGNLVYQAGEPTRRVIVNPSLAYLAHDILSDPIARRDSLGFPNFFEIGRPAAGKLGQTANGQDAWATGYTPQLLVTTWFGLPQDTTTPVAAGIPGGLWYAVMQYASRDLPTTDWLQPEGVVAVDVCDPSGLLPTVDCPSMVRELFLQGSEPTGYDTLYRKLAVNRETGMLATVFTPLELIEERTFMIVPSEAEDWAKAAGVTTAPTTYDAIAIPPTMPDVNITSPPMFAYINGEVVIAGSARGEGFDSYRLQVGRGLNPATWQQLVETGEPVDAGELGTWQTNEDGVYALRLLVLRDDQSVETAVIQVTVDNQAPSVEITYPLSDQEIEAGSDGSIYLQGLVGDQIGIQRVTYLMDGKEIGHNTNAPYSLAWHATRGEHTLQLNVTDLAGNSTESEPVTFTVK